MAKPIEPPMTAVGVERALEDEREGLRNILNAADNNNKSAEYIGQDRHDGHELRQPQQRGEHRQ